MLASPPIRSKLPAAGTTIFTVMSRLANEQRRHQPVAGFPGLRLDPALHRAGARATCARAGTSTRPCRACRRCASGSRRRCERLYGASYDPDTEITVTSGATEALFAAITAVVHPGDEAVLFEPATTPTRPPWSSAAACPVFCTHAVPRLPIDWDGVKRRDHAEDAPMILNSPHNPTGAVLSAARHRRARATSSRTPASSSSATRCTSTSSSTACGTRAWRAIRSSRGASFVISSFGKTYHATGWKVGYCGPPAALSAEFRKIHQYLTFAVNTPVQDGAGRFSRTERELPSLRRVLPGEARPLPLAHRRIVALQALPSRGTYFQMLDYSAITDEPDTEFARRMTREHGVAAIPPSVFYHDGADNRCSASASPSGRRRSSVRRSGS